MAYYAPIDFLADDAFLERMKRMRGGELTLDWMDTNVERVRCRPRSARRGLTYADIDVGSYGTAAIPEVIRDHRSMAPRGASERPPRHGVPRQPQERGVVR